MSENGSKTWRVTRESAEWVGPVNAAAINRSTGEPVAIDVVFAVLPRGTRPTDADWQAPYLDPDGTGDLGVWCDPVLGYQQLGIWAKDRGNPESPVLEPSQVGWITRT